VSDPQTQPSAGWDSLSDKPWVEVVEVGIEVDIVEEGILEDTVGDIAVEGTLVVGVDIPDNGVVEEGDNLGRNDTVADIVDRGAGVGSLDNLADKEDIEV